MSLSIALDILFAGLGFVAIVLTGCAAVALIDRFFEVVVERR